MDINIGTKVRSFDFHYRRDLEGPESCYMEGVVTGFDHIRGCDRYIIAVNRCVSGGKDQPAQNYPPEICPPVNGTRTTMGRVTDGVEIIS